MTEAQTRKPREAGSRTQQMRRPERWSRPEGLPSPDDRPGWKHRWVRVSMMGSADAKNISSNAAFRQSSWVNVLSITSPRTKQTWNQWTTAL